ncbi:hypothetical protein [Paenibacillus amylolyticus]|uniref:hypothetical protein n=1 Tax=Paenibacillus amylolyticus TaxID=1451 RepID=UPI00286C7F00|nr:hypothetical protein [Paenibacillus amylolyticus]
MGILTKSSMFSREANPINAINDWLKQLAHNYVLIVIAAVLFFVVKAIIGYYTYKHYDKKLKLITDKVDRLLEEIKRN